LSELKSAIINPYSDFEKLGLKDNDNKFHQISNGILQIENELYDCIRPKRAGQSGQRPYQLLKNKAFSMLRLEELISIQVRP
jgi:glutamate--cysteine ligase